jgi:hypothetical protein
VDQKDSLIKGSQLAIYLRPPQRARVAIAEQARIGIVVDHDQIRAQRTDMGKPVDRIRSMLPFGQRTNAEPKGNPSNLGKRAAVSAQ